jgi:hypothetical protein
VSCGDRILHGANPVDRPVRPAPTKYETIFNLKRRQPIEAEVRCARSGRRNAKPLTFFDMPAD